MGKFNYNNFKKEIESYNNKQFKLLTKEHEMKKSSDYISILCKKCNNVIENTKKYYLLKSIKKGNCGCRYCSNRAVPKDIIEKRIKNLSNEYLFLENNITRSRQKILVEHKKCNHQFKTDLDTLERYYPCKKCSKILPLNDDAIINYVNSVDGYELYSLNNYKTVHSKIKIIHKDQNCKNPENFEMTINNFKNKGQRCPFCKMESSKGELSILQWLQDHNLSFKREFIFEDCKNKRALPFDFYVENKYLIEYDGEQHFKMRADSTPEHFKRQLENDKIKNEYCKKNNILLIRISYKEFNKINEILEKELNELISSH